MRVVGTKVAGVVGDQALAQKLKCILLPSPVVELLFSRTSPWTSVVLLARAFKHRGASRRATCSNIFPDYPDPHWHAQALQLLTLPLPSATPMDVTSDAMKAIADRLRSWSSSILRDGHDEHELRRQVRFLDAFANKLADRRDNRVAGEHRYKHSAERLLSAFQADPSCNSNMSAWEVVV